MSCKEIYKFLLYTTRRNVDINRELEKAYAQQITNTPYTLNYVVCSKVVINLKKELSVNEVVLDLYSNYYARNCM